LSELAPPIASAPVSEGAALIDERLLRIGQDGDVRLVCGRCASCGAESFPQAAVCASCLSQDIEPFELAGPGTLYAYSIVHQAPRHWDVPYAVGYVDFPGGLRVFGHIAGPFEKLSIGKTVELKLGKLGARPDGTPLSSYVFAVKE